ncbi:hypothetical protein B0T17DRAFT_621363 [Bombardia bombarda]|uniref:Uncharacterized protein n=1 Tax=Bombardia bombarda TaxID=252184 RepID=A0AA39TM22_9PEZI|nr:hypothetical protein B0T17DRAFT_621363 [Bombardia bombarda]
MAPRQGSISSDWEDVGDDNMSVISLPSSDDEASSVAPYERAPPSPALATALDSSTSNSQYVLAIRSAPVPAQPDDHDEMSESAQLGCNDDGGASLSEKEEDVEAKAGHNHSSGASTSSSLAEMRDQVVENPFLDPPPSEGFADDSFDDTVDELFDDGSRDVDPIFLQKTLHSLREILDDTAVVLSDLPLPNCEIMEPSMGLCGRLSRQVSELDPIVSGYAKLWPTSSRDLPLDPGLHSWLSGVRVKILSLQAEAQRIGRDPNPKASHTFLPSIWEDLDEYERKMADFLPIMRVDYNEFHTKQMMLPTAPPLDAFNDANPAARSAPIDIPHSHAPSHEMWMLRRNLYHLKDVIQKAIEKLSDITGILQRSSQTSLASLAKDLVQVYGRLFNTIGLVLSNHGSDWIDSGLNGGLTYFEFLELDPNCVADFSRQLTSVLRQVGGTASENGSGALYPGVNNNIMEPFIHDRYVASMRHELIDVGATIEASPIECLESLAIVLEATFTPQRDRDSPRSNNQGR